MEQNPLTFWFISAADLLRNLQVTVNGISGKKARKRLASYGPNRLKPQKRSDTLTLLVA